jgi:hypothetical protein
MSEHAGNYTVNTSHLPGAFCLLHVNNLKCNLTLILQQIWELSMNGTCTGNAVAGGL